MDLVLISGRLPIDDDGAPPREEEGAAIYFEDALKAAIEQRDLGVLAGSLLRQKNTDAARIHIKQAIYLYQSIDNDV